MKTYNFNYYLKKVLINGSVCYENGKPIKNAIVFLDVFSPQEYDGHNVKYCKMRCGYTVTNCMGKFHLYVFDVGYYYKITVFDNKDNNVKTIQSTKNITYSINLD